MELKQIDKKTKQKIERKVTPLDIIKLKRTFLTYQYETQKFGFLSLHQKVIIESLANYYDNPDYVSPEAEKSEYKGLDSFDFTITKKSSGKKVEKNEVSKKDTKIVSTKTNDDEWESF